MFWRFDVVGIPNLVALAFCVHGPALRRVLEVSSSGRSFGYHMMSVEQIPLKAQIEITKPLDHATLCSGRQYEITWRLMPESMPTVTDCASRIQGTEKVNDRNKDQRGELLGVCSLTPGHEYR